MTTEDILAMLRDGDSIEDIGNHFAKLMNEAKSQYDQEQKNKEEEKLSRLTDIMDSLINWIDEYVAPVPEEINGETYAKELIDTFNSVQPLVDELFNTDLGVFTLNKNMDNTKNQKKEVKAASSRQQDLDLKDIVDMFLREENIV